MARLYDYLKREKKLDDPDNAIHIIVADAIQQSINEETQTDYQWQSSDFICTAPPYAHFVVETRIPDTKEDYTGIFTIAASAEDGIPFQNLQTRLSKNFPEFTEARWIFICHTAYKAQKSCGFLDCTLYIAIDQEGGVLTDLAAIPVETTEDTPQDIVNEATARVPLLLKTLNLLNLVNVELVDNIVPPALKKSSQKKYKVALADHKELVIKGKTKVNLSRQERRAISDRRAHEVRGHIKHRKTGAYYWKPFLRNSSSDKSISKTYRVEE